MLRRVALSLAALLSVSCSKSGPESELPVHSFEASSPKWEPCPESSGGPGVHCLRAEVPLNHQEKDGSSTVILARRILADGSEGQIWLLDGGPGFAGHSFLDATFVEQVQRAHLDLYIPSHRGTFDESLLECPNESSPDSSEGARITPAEWVSCRATLEEKWGNDLSFMSASAAARDVAYLMAQHPTDGRKLVFGGSYGTLWAQRLFEIEDTGVTGAWLDSIVDLEGSLERVDEHADRAMRALLRKCEEIDACAARFEGAPLDAALAVVSAYNEGNGCGQAKGIDRDAFQAFMHAMLSGPPESWAIASIGFARAARCSKADQDALLHAIKKISEPAPSSPTSGAPSGYSAPLNRVMLYRELFRFDVSDMERKTFEESALAQSGTWPQIQQEAQAFGSDFRDPDPLVPLDADFPIYLLSGDLDPLDPPAWAQSTAERFDSATLIQVPWAGHSVLRFLGLGENTCGQTLFGQFLTGSPIKSDCAEELPPPDFSDENEALQAAEKTWFAATGF